MKKEPLYVREVYVKYRNKRVPRKASHILKSRIPSSDNISKLFSNLKNETVEKTYVVNLDNKKKMRSFSLLSIDSFDNVIRKPVEIFKSAILTNSTSIILVHNHPSGNPMPSNNNIYVTKILKHIGKLIGIELLDHVIIGNDKYYSFKEKYIQE